MSKPIDPIRLIVLTDIVLRGMAEKKSVIKIHWTPEEAQAVWDFMHRLGLYETEDAK